VGNESGRVPYENWNVIDRHGYLRWRPVEADTPLRNGHWFWHPNDESSLKSLNELLTTYNETVGRGAQLMLGLAPDRRGLLPDSDVARLEEFGNALRMRYTRNLALAHSPASAEISAALDGNPDTFWTAPAGSHHSTLEAVFSSPVTFNRTITMEWLNAGQRIQKYSIDIWTGTVWKTVVTSGAIGHKKIDIFPPVTASRVRLNILSSTDAAAIREFQMYNTTEGGEPK
jgi:alpha-L-fucosidase